MCLLERIIIDRILVTISKTRYHIEMKRDQTIVSSFLRGLTCSPVSAYARNDVWSVLGKDIHAGIYFLNNFSIPLTESKGPIFL